VTERERTAINEALHELRRPLQALALCGGGPRGDVVASSARLAAVALERLDREVNGGGGGGERPRREPLRCEAALRSAVRRWHARVALGGGSLELRWRAGEAVMLGDAVALEQAVDNLIVNAIEHGGPEIVVECRRRAGRLVVSVADSVRRSSTKAGAVAAPRSAGRIVVGGRRGHGLGLVRRFAASHGGRFVFHRADRGSVAILELPLVAGRLTSDLAA
jgi:signal transduction histidine kinase